MKADKFTYENTRIRAVSDGGVELKAVVFGRPMSTNHMYTHWHGRMVLKAAGRKFQDAVVQAMSGLCLDRLWGTRSRDIYVAGGWASLRVLLRFPNQYNGTWKRGDTRLTEKGSLRSPYKKLDGSNYFKCIEDGVVKATGIDDSLTAVQKVTKDFSWTGPPQVLIRYTVWLPQS